MNLGFVKGEEEEEEVVRIAADLIRLRFLILPSRFNRNRNSFHCLYFLLKMVFCGLFLFFKTCSLFKYIQIVFNLNFSSRVYYVLYLMVSNCLFF